MELNAQSQEEIEQVRGLLKAHVTVAKGERLVLRYNIQASRADPASTHVISFDQTNSFNMINFPYPHNPVRLLGFVLSSRSLSAKIGVFVSPQLKSRKPLPSMSVGALYDHTRGLRYVVITPPSTAKTASFLLTQVYHVIMEAKKSSHPVAKARRLVLHFDGGSENNNKLMFCFAQWLVEQARFVGLSPRFSVFDV